MPSFAAVKRAPGGRPSVFEGVPDLPAAVLGWTSSAPAAGFCGVVAGTSVFLSLAGLSALASSFGASAAAPSSITAIRSEEHTSELQSLMRNSYAVFCLKKKINPHHQLC